MGKVTPPGRARQSSQQRRQWCIVAGLALFAIIVFLVQYRPMPGQAEAIASTQRVTQSRVMTTPPPQREPIAISWSLRVERDPFDRGTPEPPTPKPQPVEIVVTQVKHEPPGFAINAIIISGNQPRVLIEGRVLQQGESIGGYVIVNIQPRRVLLQKEGRRYELTP